MCAAMSFALHRIEQEMRIAERVDVALGAIERGRDLEHLDPL